MLRRSTGGHPGALPHHPGAADLRAASGVRNRRRQSKPNARTVDRSELGLLDLGRLIEEDGNRPTSARLDEFHIAGSNVRLVVGGRVTRLRMAGEEFPFCPFPSARCTVNNPTKIQNNRA